MLSVWRILRKIAQKINSCNTDYFFHLSLVFQGIIHLLTSKKTNDSRCFQNLFAMRMINTSTQEMGKDPLDTNSLSNKWNWNLFDELVSWRKKICLSLYKIVFPTLISFFHHFQHGYIKTQPCTKSKSGWRFPLVLRTPDVIGVLN